MDTNPDITSTSSYIGSSTNITQQLPSQERHFVFRYGTDFPGRKRGQKAIFRDHCPV